MSQMKDIARGLSANGAATRPDNDGYYLLFTDGGKFVVKHWTGEAFGSEQLVTNSVRPGSTAAYIPASDANAKPLAICITSSSRVAAYQYDETEEEWTQDSTLPTLTAHPSGKLAATLWKARVHVVFQGEGGELVYVSKLAAGGSWSTIELTTAVQPRIGTALCFSHPDGGDIFYVSAADECIHSLCDTKGWADTVLATAPVEPLKQLFVASRETMDYFEAYALTEENKVPHVPSGGEKTIVGEVREDGSYVSKTKAEWCININVFCVIA